MAGPGFWVAAGFFALVVFVGIWSFWRHWTDVVSVERRRSEGYRHGLQQAATLSASAKNVRCPTCLTNWTSIQTLCDLALVSGDSVGTAEDSRG
jgi:ABC-type nickel/cobalt efflux system permease component RcnA